MDLNELIEQQERCRNRLWDVHMQELYLATQKEINKLAEATVLVIESIDDT